MIIKHEIYINSTLEQVWDALTAPEYVKQIYYGSVIESTYQLGDKLAYVGPGADGERTIHVYGTILAYEPEKQFSFTHHTGPSYYQGEPFESRITYQLEQVGETVKLTLIHDQWEENDPSYQGSLSSWPMILSNTKTLIETGKVLQFQ